MRILVISVALVLAGCSTTNEPTDDVRGGPEFTEAEKASMTAEEKAEIYNASVATDDDRLVCRRRMTTGSHMRRTTCRSRAEMREDREAAQEALGRIRTNTTAPPN